MAHPSDPLSGAHFKIIWANNRLTALESSVTAYLKTDPYKLQTHIDDDEVRIGQPFMPDAVWPQITGEIGDTLNAFRSVLDYIIWDLAAKHVGRDLVPPPLGDDRPSFPIYGEPYGVNNQWTILERRYKIPTNALREIERVQPYNAGYEPLGTLHILVNQDKHRLPVLTMGHIDPGNITVRVGETSIKPAISEATHVTFEAESFRAAIRGHPQVYVQPEHAPFISFKYPTMPLEPVEKNAVGYFAGGQRGVRPIPAALSLSQSFTPPSLCNGQKGTQPLFNALRAVAVCDDSLPNPERTIPAELQSSAPRRRYGDLVNHLRVASEGICVESTHGARSEFAVRRSFSAR